MLSVATVGKIIGQAPALIGRLPSLADHPLESPSAIQQLAYWTLNPGKNFLVPARWLRALMKTSRSPLIAESLVRPGGWRSMELVYRNATPVDWLDRQALRDNPISMAARNRRKIVGDRLTRLIRQQSHADHLTLLGIGSGPGWHIQTAIADSGIPKSRVTAHLIDLEDDSFAYGRALACSFGLQDSVQFHQGDARRVRESLPCVSVQIAKLIGIVEYLTDDQFYELLKAVREVMVPGGSLITHGLVDRYGTGPFLARVFNLRHQQRDAEQLTKILTEAGFHVTECEYEPTGIHPILTAIRN